MEGFGISGGLWRWTPHMLHCGIVDLDDVELFKVELSPGTGSRCLLCVGMRPGGGPNHGRLGILFVSSLLCRLYACTFCIADGPRPTFCSSYMR